MSKKLKKEFSEFVEEHHTTTQVEPRLLSEDKVWKYITQVFAKRVERRMIKKMQKIMSGGVGGYLRSGGYIISQENWDKFKKKHE